MNILRRFKNNDNREQFLIPIFLNDLKYEIKKLVGIQEFANYNNCTQLSLKAQKLIPNKKK